MNKEQLKGATKHVVGKIQEKATRAFGSGSQQFKGLIESVHPTEEKN